MKTPKEIEQLAKQLCNIPIDLVIDEEERYYKNLQKYDGIILGYTQCQEDMAEKKYTEEDLLHAFREGVLLPNSQIGIMEDIFKQVVHSLNNKQD